MAQMGFFDADKRLSLLSAKGDPLVTIKDTVPWDSFRSDIEAVALTPTADKKSKAGRKPIDCLILFRMIVLQSLYNLSDDQIEYQLRDRLSFMRFIGLGFEDTVPDGTTLWLFREKLANAGLMDNLFQRFNQHLQAKGYIARGGQMVDATIVEVPKQRNTRDENKAIKAAQTPKDWEAKPAKNQQKDKDARWTKKHSKSYYGYKNHINADAKYKFIRAYKITDAAVHDSKVLDDLVKTGAANTSSDLYADSAYRSAETEIKLKASNINSRIHERGKRGQSLSKRQQKSNRTKSKVRARIEHIFGAQETAQGGRLVRTIGVVRAKAKIALQNFCYNVRRLATLERMAKT